MSGGRNARSLLCGLLSLWLLSSAHAQIPDLPARPENISLIQQVGRFPWRPTVLQWETKVHSILGFFGLGGGSSMWLLSDKNESNLLRYTKSTVTYQFDPVVCWVFSLLQSLSVQVFGTHCVSYSTFPVWPEHSLSLFDPAEKTAPSPWRQEGNERRIFIQPEWVWLTCHLCSGWSHQPAKACP